MNCYVPGTADADFIKKLSHQIFIKQVLQSSIVLDAGNRSVNKTDQTPALLGMKIYLGKIENK